MSIRKEIRASMYVAMCTAVGGVAVMQIGYRQDCHHRRHTPASEDCAPRYKKPRKNLKDTLDFIERSITSASASRSNAT